MGSCLNFDNINSMAQPESAGVGRPAAGNFPLARQSSIYSMTFDELQSFGSLGKDFGSMNMEDLLKNIWTADETQVNNYTVAGNGISPAPAGGNLQRQGSLTLPRTLSQRTVDEVWKDLFKESGGNGALNLGPREPTLGEMSLEEFLARAGVVREDVQPAGKPNHNGGTGIFGGINSNSVSIEFQQPALNQGVMANQMATSKANSFSNPSNIMHRRAQQSLFPKQATVAFTSPLQMGNNVNNPRMTSPRATASAVGGMMPSNASVNSALVQGGVTPTGVMGIAGLQGVTTSVVGGTPGNQLHSDLISKSNMDSPSLSPSPYAISEVGRGRRSSSSLEKQVERRRRRMIKNRESAARSRARKQAYSLELEAEIAKLKEVNQELQKKQIELVEMQKNQILETNQTMKMPWRGKGRCLRRTLTGPW